LRYRKNTKQSKEREGEREGVSVIVLNNYSFDRIRRMTKVEG